MRSHLSILILVILLHACSSGDLVQTDDGNDKELTLAFYNVENLFDIENDPEKLDDEFTPGSERGWTKERYEKKLQDLAKVILSIDREFPEVIGLAEVENRKVVEDLITKTGLKAGRYSIIHRESPDARGIDCALLYRKDQINISKSSFYRSSLPAGDRPDTRLLIYAQGVKDTDTLHLFVNHWPSRYGGQEETEPNRMTLALLLREKTDSIRMKSPNAKIILMGDFNDYPNDRSIKDVLEAGIGEENNFINLMEPLHKDGLGSYNYKGKWGALDQFIISPELMYGKTGLKTGFDQARFHKEEWMLYTNKDGTQSPSRTMGREYYGGYSDHLPIVLQLTE